ncbi:PREDICTED: C-type lectin domain family 4 member E-like isoform X1 [Calidris pugnax]|uniref:C-type lectin domain family 4 member E-like isoform X1 n=1 Tax=Calidris pugnax TaxID=198806 RepID=UPI00071CB7FC|nr:PREDICTED: C-type lectin domain family 4 member E-like isoform X1 [Calidris pugnax]XP_014795564.1 PREDICTED: C-type lectin domain family 4 member E-like isoform X1 [Calidris pugnax]
MNRRGRVSSGTAAPAEERSCSWLNPWVFLVSVLAIKTAFVTICCFVVFLHGSYGQSKTLLQNATEWYCVSNISAGKQEGCVYCPKGWKHFQEKCYYLSADKMSWPESVQNCTGMMGSQLVVINSKEEQEFLFNLAKEVSTKAFETKFYIGLAASESGQWQWVDQTPYNKAATFWKPGEPNLLFAEKCAAIHVKGKRDPNTYSNWNNVLCFTSCYRICELTVKYV